MSTTDENRQGGSIDWDGDCDGVEFTPLPRHTRPIEARIPDNPDRTPTANEIEEHEVVSWLTRLPATSSDHGDVVGLRLIALTNARGSSTFPLKRETLESLVKIWFPNLQLPIVSILIGGCSVFTVNPKDATKINFVLGGGIYEFSIGGLFSYDCRFNITSGLIVSGSAIPPAWIDVIPDKFREAPHPMTIAITMAEVLILRSMVRRRSYNQGINKLEKTTRSGPDSQTTITISPQASGASQDHRGLAVRLSGITRDFGVTQMLLERSRLQLGFIAKSLDPNQGSPFIQGSCHTNLENSNQTILRRAEFMLASIEYMKSEHQNALQRMQSQNMVISNLIAQQDVRLSMEVARDSRELASASRRDSSIMRRITFLGSLFLPGTLIATVFSMPPPFNLSSRLQWVYFVVAIPVTFITIIVFRGNRPRMGL